MSIKIIANYLPQYHSIPENDKWWGKGYTDWMAVKKARPLFEGHYQPNVPLNNNYYDLSKEESIQFQVDLAEKYGIWGFGIYHYWFNSEMMLLEKPAEIILNSKMNIHFMFIWDNGSWKRTWSNVRRGMDWAPNFDNEQNFSKNSDDGLLAELIYGNEDDWKKHFDYLLPFFKDERYIRINEKPVFAYYQPDNNPKVIKNMVHYWNQLAKESGLNGLYFLAKRNYKNVVLDGTFDYEPLSPTTYWNIWERRIKNVINRIAPRTEKYNYDILWKKYLKKVKKSNEKKHFFCAYVNFDDTPRRGKKGKIILGGSPEKFEKYLTELLKISKCKGKEYVFLTAWNEWGEGAYLEPDEKNGFAYLEAVKNSLDFVNEDYN